MTVIIDAGSAVPPYEQVRTQLAQRINDGRLPVGSKLPTVRQLAIDLDIAANTVARACFTASTIRKPSGSFSTWSSHNASLYGCKKR